jgi:Na+/H+-dicarboxylate symporter
MINYRVSKNDAKKVYMARMIIIIPSVLIGLTLGLIFNSDKLSLDKTIKFVIPMFIILAVGAIYLGIKTGINRMTNTVFVIDNESIVEETNTGFIKTINIKDIMSIKENIFGLIIKDSKKKIGIPKQLECYSEIKHRLKTIN